MLSMSCADMRHWQARANSVDFQLLSKLVAGAGYSYQCNHLTHSHNLFVHNMMSVMSCQEKRCMAHASEP